MLLTPGFDQPDQRRAPTRSRRPDDHDVLADRHVQHRRRQRRRSRDRPPARRPARPARRVGPSASAGTTCGKTSTAAGPPSPASGSGSSSATCASSPEAATTSRPGIAGGTRVDATPSVGASLGSSRWNTQRWANRASTPTTAACGVDDRDRGDAHRRSVGEHPIELGQRRSPFDVVERTRAARSTRRSPARCRVRGRRRTRNGDDRARSASRRTRRSTRSISCTRMHAGQCAPASASSDASPLASTT